LRFGIRIFTLCKICIKFEEMGAFAKKKRERQDILIFYVNPHNIIL
jgi:hypothetical protein